MEPAAVVAVAPTSARDRNRLRWPRLTRGTSGDGLRPNIARHGRAYASCPTGTTGVFERHSHLERRLRVIATPRRHWWRYAAIPLYALFALGALAAAALPPAPIDHALGVRNQTYRTTVEIAQQRAEEHRVRARLLANGGPDALAAAAVFMYRADTLESPAWRARARAGYLGAFIPPDAAKRYRWLEDAAAAAPQRADLAMMELRYCRAWNPNCDLATLRRRLLALDPGNGAVWLVNLDRAYEKHDAAGIDAALTRIAESQRVDSFGTRLVPVLFHAIHDLGGAAATNSYEWAAQAASGGMADLEAMIAIENACTTNARGIPADRTQVCRGVALALEHGDNLLYAQVGYNLAMRLWSDETPEGLLARAGKRRLDYLEQASAKRPWPNPLNLALGSERYFWLVNEPILRAETHYPREQDVWRAVLMNEGINPDPPKTWQDQRIRGSGGR